MTISFGGLTDKTFIKAHKVDKLKEVLEKVEIINNYKKNNTCYPRLRLVLVVMKSNAHELPLAVKIAKKYKFSERLKITYLKAFHQNLIKELPFNNKEYVQKYVRKAQELGKKWELKLILMEQFVIQKLIKMLFHRRCLEPWQRLHMEIMEMFTYAHLPEIR